MANKKDTQGLTPEKKEDTAEVVSGDSDVRRQLFEDGKSVFVICILIENN